jgi:hypothetical protein
MKGEIIPNPPGVFPLSKTYHRSSQTLLPRIFFSKDEEVVLWSNGTLSTNHNSQFFGDNREILNLCDVTNLMYSSGKIRHPNRYRVFNLFSAVCGLILVSAIPTFFSAILSSSNELSLYLPAIAAMAFWFNFDFNREMYARPEILKFKLPNNESHSVEGDLPNTGLHEIGTLGMLVGWLFGIATFIEYVTGITPFIADVIAYLIGAFVALLMAIKLLNYLSSGDRLPGLLANSCDIAHLYFAASSLSIVNPPLLVPSNSENRELSPKIVEFQKRLERHEDIISVIEPAKDIFIAPSASLGVLTIGITTEKLMKIACEHAGIKWSPNARPTLKSYVEKYNSVRKIDSKTMSCFTLIMVHRNRAAHDFNIDIDEFMETLNRFCFVVDWYSSTITGNQPQYPSELEEE